ncbi:hypothetical protein COU74_02525 [Candidatus Peregrinibacteria bacterium CG10_big_fil_rev_8_21_14_0_10_36_19]|nr:MAG: hypothetical protein COU74_02525 [Candidatus Peregrinibacteria bacterium CG10_big_fil_rev_8_21_14_0_10_36_19]
MKIEEKIKIIQQLSQLTQTQLAARLSVSFPTLNSWINGKSQPHTKKAETINELYKKLTGQKVIPTNQITAKKDIILKKSKKFKSIIEIINSRPDIHDQLVLSFTYNTNSIEGSTLTENETAAILFQNTTFKNKDLIEHLEAKNHQSALEYLFSRINKKFKITEELILELHKILMNSIRPDAGTYRSHGVRIVGANVPTVNYIKIPKLMSDLTIEINKKSKDTISQAAIIHSKFEQIHPFSDGNGRIGRLIMAAMLMKEGIAPAVIKKQKKHLYYKALQKSQQKQEFEGLDEFICDAILNGFEIIEA